MLRGSATQIPEKRIILQYGFDKPDLGYLMQRIVSSSLSVAIHSLLNLRPPLPGVW